MIALKILSKLIKTLRSNAAPSQIAWGFVLGMILGLTPLWNLHNLLVILLLIIFNVNLGAATLAFLVFSLFAYLLDPLFHNLGYFLLVEVESLRPLWVFCCSTPILAFANLNNTVVLGSLVSSLVLLLPVFFLFKKFVVVYRQSIDPRVQQLKIMQIINSSKIVNLYQQISRWGE